MEDLLKDYPARINIPVQWGDMDAAQHVNNVIYLRWFESARIQYFEAIQELMDFTGAADLGAILAETYCRYKMPVTFPDTVIVGARVLPDTLDEFSFRMQHIVVSQQHQRIAAEGWTRIVCYDYQQKRKAPIPENLRAKILKLEQNQ
ncbi:MAG: acyl-CoA thioesterase [Saprospiraceae bacterium]